jgi:hypothetical protein
MCGDVLANITGFEVIVVQYLILDEMDLTEIRGWGLDVQTRAVLDCNVCVESVMAAQICGIRTDHEIAEVELRNLQSS